MRPQILPCPWGCLGRLVGARAPVLWSKLENLPQSCVQSAQGTAALAA